MLDGLSGSFSKEKYEFLKTVVSVPEEFIPIFTKLITEVKGQILESITEEFLSTSTFTIKLGESLEKKHLFTLNSLVKKNFLLKQTRETDIVFKSKCFYEIIKQYLAEGKFIDLEQENYVKLRNYYLKTRLLQTEQEIAAGSIDYSSRVIPIKKSLQNKQHILPQNQVLEILKTSNLFVLTNCECRLIFNNCEKPRETCLMLDQAAENLLSKNLAREITLDEAERIIQVADKAGLVHLSLYQPRNKIFAICSCCPCCCHDLQGLIRFGQEQIISHSDFIANFNPVKCNNCGRCIERCVFDARSMKEGKLQYLNSKCFGCGLCVTTCPTGAIELVKR